MPATKIDVHIKRPIIRCTPKGGHFRGGRGNKLRWMSNDAAFTLLVTDFDSGAPAWPFLEPQPTTAVTDTNDLTLDPALPVPAYFKYTLQADGCSDLDPIIIVDR
ncbi:MAG TPA: hypothetical protein VL176_02635 [Steroidobacteraceae bacterium]|jgi:hypothetical protein|nr:hypothetical protein [Steroidobacteraceae bacterium]